MIYIIILIVLGPAGRPGPDGEQGRIQIVHCKDNTDKVHFIIYISNWLCLLNS